MGLWVMGCGTTRKDTQRVDPDDGDALCGTEQSRAEPGERAVATKEIETQWVGKEASPKQQRTCEKCSQNIMKMN